MASELIPPRASEKNFIYTEESTLFMSAKYSLHYLELAKIHWRVQATVHLILSIPIAFLTVYSWGIPLSGLYNLAISYLALSIFVFAPTFGSLPLIYLYPIKKSLSQYHKRESIPNEDLTKMIGYLINLPAKVAISIGVLELVAFGLGAMLWKWGFVPEFMPILNIVLLETIILGIVVAINMAFLNLILLENYMGNAVEAIIVQYPHILEQKMPIRPFSMYSKIFLLIFLTSVAGEISIFIFFITNILSTNPESLLQNAVFVFAAILINLTYIFVLAPVVASNFITPLRKLANWTKNIATGKIDSRIAFMTNDETGDIIRGSNIMINLLTKANQDINVSMQRLAQDRNVIEEERNKLSAVLNGVIDGVIALDKNLQVVLINKAGQEISGWQNIDIIGSHIDAFFHLTRADNQPVTAQEYTSTQNLENTQTFTANNLTLVTKTGKHKKINITCSPINTQISTNTAFIVTFHDLTQQSELEEMKLDFVSMAAHELRTPLTTIKGYMSLFLEQNGSHLPPDQLELLNKVANSSQRLDVLIENLLSITKIERKVMKLNLTSVNWGKLVKEIVDSLQYMASEKHIHLTAVIPENFNITIQGDKIRMLEIFDNLISNAINYTPEGGSVTVFVEDRGFEIVTHIQDTGIGIPENAIPHLFTKFFRVTSKLVAGSKGTGLGLYITKAIVEMHGGKIWVNSQENKGSTFSFSMPKEQQANPATINQMPPDFKLTVDQ